MRWKMAFPLRQLIDIHPYAFGSTFTHSVVNDVSSNRALVGFGGNGIGSNGHAFAFPLALTTPSISAVDLHTTSGAYSCAFGASDAITSIISGQTSEACDLEEPDFVGPFKTTWSSGGGAGTMVILPQFDEGDIGRAFDVSKGSTTSGFLIAGETFACEEDNDTDICTQTFCPTGCLAETAVAETAVAMRWTSSSSFDDLDGLVVSGDSGVHGRGINDDGDVCGWGWVGSDPNCERRAAFWNGSSNASHIPGNTMPSGQSGDESWAEGISPRTTQGCTTVVGMNLFEDHGLIWHGFDDTWCVEDLNDITLPCSNNLLIRRAFDINQYRHVVVLVDDFVAFETHAAVLTSAADFNGDLRVDNTDRTMLFAHYCSSGCSATQLEYDLNCDGVVGSGDMALLTGTYWSGTALARVPAICSCSQGESLTAPMDESSALAVLGFTTWDAFSDWLAQAETEAADAACTTIHYLLSSDD